MGVGSTKTDGIRDVAGQRVVDGAGRGGLPLEANAAGEVRLGVHVDQQDALLVGNRERGGQVYGCGRFADTTLLVGDGEDPG